MLFIVGIISQLDASSDNYSAVVIGKYKDELRANSSIEGFKDIILSEPTLKALKKKNFFNISKKKIEDQYLISVGPFYDDEVLAVVFYSLKEYFPNAIVIRYTTPISKLDNSITDAKNYYNPKKITENIVIDDKSSNWLPWILILILIGITIGIFLYYRRYIEIIESKYANIQKSHKDLEESQNLLLSTVSQRIKDSVEEIISQRDNILQTTITGESCDIEEKSKSLKNADELLLDTTSDLIVFLKLKSKKLEIEKELFNINTLLNEISGQLLNKYPDSNIELIFDINNNVPQLLVGDSNHISTIILNLFEQSLKTTTKGDIKLNIDTLSIEDNNIKLEIKIADDGSGIDEARLSQLFVPFKNENIEDDLGLYIAKELIDLMNGDITVRSKEDEGTVFTIILPLEINSANRELEDRESRLGIKKILIVEKNNNSAYALEKILRYFGYDTTLKSAENLEDSIGDLKYFDILALDLSILTPSLARHINDMKSKTGLKVVGLSNLLNKKHIDKDILTIIDKHLIKPLHRERVYEVLSNIFNHNSIDEKVETTLLEAPIKELPKEDNDIKEKVEEEKIEEIKYIPRVYKGEIHDAEGIEKDDFIVFRGAKLLIVEDNTINQKVILRVLNKSGIKIDIASNGEEALRLIEDKKGDYDFILMDISMPIMDGYEATKIIRKNDNYIHIPIVSLTSLGLDHEIKKMYESGMNACLIKPLKIGQLYSVFSLFLKKQTLLDEPSYDDEIYDDETEDEEIYYIEDNSILDTRSGIVYSKGNEILYIEILKEFLEVYANNFKQFKSYVESEDYDKVLALTRDMSGLSGAIGAHNMTHLLSEINQLFIYGAQKQLALYIDGYKKELGYLTHQIEQYIASRNI
ncbi:conserved protein of unknown function; putative sensory transduction histidine kinase [hydrothermal vent metagenome]|uniref:Histidine kinase n=1 Tax=hydrothermal vent metagenome TaxID=652676 RepID=A0A1W1EJU9_9ZZZZ